jgi:hypothetical protein
MNYGSDGNLMCGTCDESITFDKCRCAPRRGSKMTTMKAKFTCEISEGFSEGLTLTCDLEWDGARDQWRAVRGDREAYAMDPATAALRLFDSIVIGPEKQGKSPSPPV